MSQLLLAVDTSGKKGSVALARAESGIGASDREPAVLEVVPLAGGAFSAELVPQIAALLKRHGHTVRDIAGLAVASGPGSFTGLRVGLAAVKALAEALSKPIVAISLLEAVAAGDASGGAVYAALDAGRGDVYIGDYEAGAIPPMRGERLLSRDEFIRLGNDVTVITPDKRLAETARLAGVRAVVVEPPDAGVIARLGWERLRRGQTIRPEDLEANYIRRSDAEIFSKPAH